MATLLVLAPSPGCFRHREVPSSPSRTVFSSVCPYLCPVCRGIVGIGAASHTALCANLCFLINSLSHMFLPVLSTVRECHTLAQALPLQICTSEVQQGHIDCNVCTLLCNGQKYLWGIKFGRFSENCQTAKFKTPPIFPAIQYF